MAAGVNLNMLNNSEAIELWQATGDATDLTDDVGIVGSLFEGCVQLLKLLLVRLRKVKAAQFYHESLENSMATLFFWGEEFGVSRGDLDRALQRSEETRDLTLSVLISLGDFLSHDLLSAALSHSSDRSDILRKSEINTQIDRARGIVMDWEEPVREKPGSVKELYTTLKAKVARLSVLGPILEDPVPDCFEVEEARTLIPLQDRPAHQYYADLISTRFPGAQASLMEVLGKCNWERYNRIQKRREANAYKELSPMGDGESKSKFHDSGLGTSVPAQSVFANEYAETILSKRAEISHKRLPPLPEEGRKGKPFLCEVCNSTVHIQRTEDWKKHVFVDILAYVCVFDDCPSDRDFFEDREAMTEHLGLQHGLASEWQSQECPLCLEQTGSGRITISLHFARHMEEIALGALPRTAESDEGSENSSLRQENTSPGTEHTNAQNNVLGTLEQDDLAHSGLSSDENTGARSARHSFHSTTTTTSSAVTKSYLGHAMEPHANSIFGKPETDSYEALGSNEPPDQLPRHASAARDLMECEHSPSKASDPNTLQLAQPPGIPAPGLSENGSLILPAPKRHKCPYCSVDFTRHHNLKSHLLTHSQEKPYECPTCQARFRRLHDLKRHVKLHTGRQPILGKPETGSYEALDLSEPPDQLRGHGSAASYLIVHEHSQSKAPDPNPLQLAQPPGIPAPGLSENGSSIPPAPKHHKCPYCSVDFTRHHNLKSHLLTHSQEKPYECPTCQARFRRLHDLKRHVRLHTGEQPVLGNPVTGSYKALDSSEPPD